jgi:hypothetical protein
VLRVIPSLASALACFMRGHLVDPRSATRVGRVMRCRCGKTSYERASAEDVARAGS